MINTIKQYDWKKYNYSLLVAVLFLCALSAFAVKMAGGEEHGMSYMKSQLVGTFLGLVIVAALSVIDYHFICKFAAIYYVFGVLLTAATHSPIGTNNDTDARRWIKVGSITFQPTELMKIVLILSLAALFAKLRHRMEKVSTLVIVVAVTGIPVPEIHAIKSVFGNDRLHLRREIGDLRIGEVAESQSLAAAFDADADLAALILQRTDILGRMAEDIAHVGTQIQ